MPKQSGLGQRFFVGGYDLSGDTGSANRIGGGPALTEVTGIDKSAFERTGLARTGGIEWASWFNPDAGHAHPVLAALPTADVHLTWATGTAVGDPAASLVGKQIDYAPTRAADGALTIGVMAESNGYGIEWGDQLTAGAASITGAASGTGFDGGAASSFGLQAYLHVISFTGTDATVLVQASSDNGVGDAFTEPGGGFAFTTVTAAPFSQRIASGSATTVERYLRQAVVTSGGFTQMTYVVNVVRNLTTTAF